MGSKEDRDKTFSAVLMDRTRHNRHEFKYRKLQLNITKKFFTIRKTQVAQGGCGLHPLGDIQNLAGHGPEQPISVCFEQASWTRWSSGVLY